MFAIGVYGDAGVSAQPPFMPWMMLQPKPITDSVDQGIRRLFLNKKGLRTPKQKRVYWEWCPSRAVGCP